MTDVDELVRRLTEPPAPTAAELATARARVLTGLTAQPKPQLAGPRRRRRGLVAAAALTTGVAAALTALSVVSTTTPRGTAPPPASAAADVLVRAAAAARQEPDVVPRPDQFVYTESRTADGTNRTWLSADGSRAGLAERQGESMTIPGCGSAPTPAPGGAAADPCADGGAYLPDLPVTKAGMLAYLGQGTSGTNQTAKKALGTTADHWVRPQARAALYEALAAVPGVTVVPDARDAVGRRGIGVRWDEDGSGSPTMVFDRTTYRFLGTEFDAVLTQAIVDRAGQRP